MRVHRRGVLIVENSGDELPPDLVRELFEPFRRLNERTSSPRGVDIGLSVVRAVATAHRGTAPITPVDGGGSRVLITTPSVDEIT